MSNRTPTNASKPVTWQPQYGLMQYLSNAFSKCSSRHECSKLLFLSYVSVIRIILCGNYILLSIHLKMYIILGDVERGLGVTCYLIKAAPDLSLVTKTYFKDSMKYQCPTELQRMHLNL
jgi:hypothetical protein